MVLLPALGKPMSAASVISFSSNVNIRSSPYSPCSAKGRGVVPPADQRRVAAPTPTPFDKGHDKAWFGEVGEDHVVVVADHGPDREAERQVFAAAPVPEVTSPMCAVARTSVRAMPVVQQRRHIWICDDEHIATRAARTTLRLAAWFAPDPVVGHDPCPSVTGAEVDTGFVDEHRRLPVAAQASPAATLTRRRPRRVP